MEEKFTVTFSDKAARNYTKEEERYIVSKGSFGWITFMPVYSQSDLHDRELFKILDHEYHDVGDNYPFYSFHIYAQFGKDFLQQLDQLEAERGMEAPDDFFCNTIFLNTDKELIKPEDNAMPWGTLKSVYAKDLKQLADHPDLTQKKRNEMAATILQAQFPNDRKIVIYW